VEKALKAWLSLVGAEYPRTHDLEELLELLEEHAEPILEAFYDLVDLTDFAVQFPYSIFEKSLISGLSCGPRGKGLYWRPCLRPNLSQR
jgi:HEPN domain-containing protein